MTPIINPWIFYWMSVVDNIGVASVTAFIASTILLFVYCLFGFVTGDNMEKRFVVLLLVVMLFSGLLSLFVPTSETITKMLLAQNVTYERVEVAADTVQSVYEDIMELFEGDDDADSHD